MAITKSDANPGKIGVKSILRHREAEAAIAEHDVYLAGFGQFDRAAQRARRDQRTGL